MPENASRATVPETVRSVPAADRRPGLGGRKIRCNPACRPPPHAFTHPVCPRTAPARRCLFRASPVTVPLFRRHPGPSAPYPCLWVGTPAPVALPPSPLRHPASGVLSPLLDPRRPTSSSFDLAVLPSLPSRPFAVCLFAPPSLSPLRFFHRKDREEPTFSAPPRVAPSVTVTKSGGFRRAAATGGGVSSTHFSPAVRYRMHKSPEHETRGRGG